MNKIHPSLEKMAVSVSELSLMDNNPRVGDVDAIMASYEEFGQVKPIVAVKSENGPATVVAGNHQLQAAINLGWDKIAVVYLDADEKRAKAFAVADNRTMELGYTDEEALSYILVEVSDVYPELFEGLGWDEFDMADMERNSIIASAREDAEESDDDPEEDDYEEIDSSEYENTVARMREMVRNDENGIGRITAGEKVDHSEVAIKGSAVAVPGSAPRTAVQYNIVFDNAEQQSTWYSFIKWLKSDPGYVGSTTAEKLINFIESHMP
jgi:ParB-like chromosome segregation protein Spo0J